MELRKRPPRFGSVEFADACDACDDRAKQHGPLVRVRRSRVCRGVGVFAARSVPAGTVMTAYPFVRRGFRRSRREAAKRSDYEYEWTRDGATLDGDPSLLAAIPPRRRPAGCAHLANDAIHREVTGRDNNCDFLEGRGDPKRPRLHLVTTRAVRRGEELLVSYSLGYWLSREKTAADPALRRWIACHRRVTEALPHLSLWEYIGTFGSSSSSSSGPEEEDEHLAYVATCSRRRISDDELLCKSCVRGEACAPRRVEVRWSAGGFLQISFRDGGKPPPEKK